MRMFRSSCEESRERQIARLRAECGCEAGGIAALAAFGLAAGMAPGTRWFVAALFAVVAGTSAKWLVILQARLRLRQLLASGGETAP